MLKTRVTSLDEVPEAFRGEYTAHPNGGFQLDTDDAKELRTALGHERQHRKTAESRATELEEQNRLLRGLPKRKPESEMTPLDRFYVDAEKRLEPLQRGSPEYAAELQKITEESGQLLEAELAEVAPRVKAKFEKDSADLLAACSKMEAERLSAALSIQGSERVLVPHLKERIGAVQGEDGKVAFTYRDAEGNPTTREGLAQELRDDPILRRVVRGESPQEKEAHARRVAATLGLKH